jgi:hypothetical protein
LLKLLLDTRRYRRGPKSFQLLTNVDLGTGTQPIQVEIEFLAPKEVKLEKNKPKLLEGFRILRADGCGTAFNAPVEITLEGKTIRGEQNTVRLRVASLPDFLIMKAHALGGRDKPKDAYDIYYCLSNFPGGLEMLAAAWKQQGDKKDVLRAIEILCEKFATVNAFGPAQVCALGDFSQFLLESGIPDVLGIDGRVSNIEEAHRRHPSVNFMVGDAEELPRDVGPFDLALCFGLLYHLENPFRTIRWLHSASNKVLIVESMCITHAQPAMMLLDEGVGENQGLKYVAFYPSEACLIKMLYRSGFPFVYRFQQLPGSDWYRSTLLRRRRRTMLVASKVALDSSVLLIAADHQHPAGESSPVWSTPLATALAPISATCKHMLARMRFYSGTTLRFLRLRR